MLKPAQLYREELQKKYVECWYKPENQYYSGWTGMQIPDLPDNCYDTHDFVSVDKDNNVIGYISYCINYVSLSVDRLGIISFKKGDLTFGRDIYESICNIFEAYGMNRIEFFLRLQTIRQLKRIEILYENTVVVNVHIRDNVQDYRTVSCMTL